VRDNELLRTAIARAVQRPQLHPAAASDNGVALFIALVAGMPSNKPPTIPVPASTKAATPPCSTLY
jgi:hypothetical protein